MIAELKKVFRSVLGFSYGTAARRAFTQLKRRVRQPVSAEESVSIREYLSLLWPRLLQSRRKVSTQLYAAFALIVALTLSASIVGWFSFDRVATAQRHVNDESIPEMVAAFQVAEYSSSLVTAAPRLVAAQTVDELDSVYSNVAEAGNSLETELADLEALLLADGETHRGFSFQKIRDDAHLLTSNIKTIRNQRSEIIVQAEKRGALREELAQIRSDLDTTLVTALDDQLFYTMTGYREIGREPDPRSVHFSLAELERYRLLAELQGDANIATELLGNAFTVSEAAALEPLKERFEAATRRIDLNLAALQGSPVHADIAPIFQSLAEVGTAEGRGFGLLDQELQLVSRQSTLLHSNRVAAESLLSEVNQLVAAAEASAHQATAASLQAILAGRSLLLMISFISIVVAALVAWLLVGRVLIRRIGILSAWMRRMASGDLEAQVEVGGHDEVADMAAAVEVFRRHALEVQRLNLVEMLAQDLQEKNDELQAAFEELRLAQDQIVSQQKLASLGELTAGVAHEIRNPLNFVKNFSESSAELLTELQEVLDEAGESINEDQRGLIQEISDDLNDNMERIRNHGDRANRIVHDMLMMSRGSGEFQLTDINQLVEEHSRLAFHSARATDTDFQLDLQFDLDPNVGELDVIPQDLGRVFLNMVSNACYATNEKRVAAVEQGESYFPALRLTTRRLEDNIEVSIRDNGSGMPPEVIEKVFNPFFTTKPSGQGTGLGLAISNDIVREHGGAVSVTSEPGEFTDMLIELPLVRPTAVLEEGVEKAEGVEEAEESEEVEEGAAVD